MFMLPFRRHFDISQAAMFSCPCESFVFLGNVVFFFFSFLEGYYFAFANIFVMSVLKSYTVVMKQRYFKYNLVVSIDL